jgi:hypothetical protein
MGDLRVRNVPVTLIDTAHMKMAGIDVKGAIGQGILQRTLSTIDYPNGRLRIRPQAVAPDRPGSVPFWLVQTHYILVWGSVNGTRSLFYVDTGGTGLGLLATRHGVERARLPVGGPGSKDNVDANGKVAVANFTVPPLTVGRVTRKGLPGAYFVKGPEFPYLKKHFPDNLTGAVSHQFFRGNPLTFDYVGMRLFMD